MATCPRAPLGFLLAGALSLSGAAAAGQEPTATRPRPGIPVRNALVVQHCSSCHPGDAEGRLTRISYMRKAPEGWELTVKRMVRQHDLRFTPEEARAMVAYLANDHGLARAEAARALYEAERRVHWSEAEADAELRATCAPCHSLGRVLAQRRDPEEWKLLKSMHLAFFPLADSQAFRGERREEGRGPSMDFAAMTEEEREEFFERRREESRRGPDRADRVLDKLARELPLFTPEWQDWQVAGREVPVEGTWLVVGREPGRGAVFGTCEITPEGPDTFATRWELDWEDGSHETRRGRGLLYAGFSWRGRSAPEGGEGPLRREVLLLDEGWERFQGRMFHGGYDELGLDLVLVRDRGVPAVAGVRDGALRTNTSGHPLDVFGPTWPEDLDPGAFHLGRGIAVTRVVRLGPRWLRLSVDVAKDAELGPRRIAYGREPGQKLLVVYDTVDALRIEPAPGFARVGGGSEHPKQCERFDAVLVHQGPDLKPHTEDDFVVRRVPARWHLEELPSREGDDDLRFVGALDPETGFFTPAIDGPNPERKWSANNIGDVFVVAEVEVMEPVRPPPPPPPPRPAPAEGREPPATEGLAPPRGGAPVAPEAAPPVPAQPLRAAPLGPPEFRRLRARAPLIVTVPIYVRYDRLAWEAPPVQGR